MSKKTSLKIASVALAAVAFAACQDSAPASITGTTSASSAPRLAATSTTSSGDTSVTSFRIDPNDNGTIVIVGGVHKLDVQKGAVCDPSTSGYGPTLWDTPC